MKKDRIILILSAIMLIGCCSLCYSIARSISNSELAVMLRAGAHSKFRGSGQLVKREIEAPAFAKLEVSRSIRLVVENRTDGPIVIEADDNVIDHVQVKCSGSTLSFTVSNKVRMLTDVHITVAVPDNGNIRSLDASSAAAITVQPQLTASSFEVRASSSSSIHASIRATQCEVDVSSAGRFLGNIESDRCSLDASSSARIHARIETESCSYMASSSGRMILSGRAVYSSGNISSAANIEASEFKTDDCIISASSGAMARVCCDGKLRATASSGGRIYFTGACTEPQIEKSSGGQVSRL